MAGARGTDLIMHLVNAGTSSFPEAWHGYQVAIASMSCQWQTGSLIIMSCHSMINQTTFRVRRYGAGTFFATWRVSSSQMKL